LIPTYCHDDQRLKQLMNCRGMTCRSRCSCHTSRLQKLNLVHGTLFWFLTSFR
jgi:hypothetical protein